MPKKNKEGTDVSSSTAARNRIDVEYLETPTKSLADNNQYRVIKLPNGIVALLISTNDKVSNNNDNTSDHSGDDEQINTDEKPIPNFEWYHPKINDEYSSCNLCINVGSFSDHQQLPGLSHTLSQCFGNPAFKTNPNELLGSDDSLEINEVKCDTTLFTFLASPDWLYDAMALFVETLEFYPLNRDDVEEARKKVEHKSQQPPYDHCKEISLMDMAYLISNLVVSGHPVKNLRKCYLDDLGQIDGETLYKEVVKFQNLHYSADRMTVVIKAELPLDTLEKYTTECFSTIPNNSLPPPSFESYNFENSFNNEEFRKIWILPPDGKSSPKLYINWTMPPSDWLHESKTIKYFKWILNHTDEGSLTHYLKKKNWTTKVHAGLGKEDALDNVIYSIFTVQIHLTEEGNNNKFDVLNIFFSYMNMLKREGPQQSIYDEMSTIQNAKFRYQWSPLSIKEFELARYMHRYEPRHYLSGPFYCFRYNPELIKIYTHVLLIPTKACIIANDADFGQDLTAVSLSFNMENGYEGATIPEKWIQHWSTSEPLPELKFPKANVFCTNNFELISEPEILEKHPVRVYFDDICEIWYKFDTVFQLPQCHMHFCYLSPIFVESSANQVMLELYAKILKYLMKDALKPAKIAGLSYEIKSRFKGLEVKVHGYNEKLPLLVKSIAKFLSRSLNLMTESIFETVKKELLLYLMNLNLVKNIERSIFMPGDFAVSNKNMLLRSITFRKCQHFVKRFIGRMYIKCLVEGNMNVADAIENSRAFVELSKCGPLPPNLMPRLEVTKIERDKRRCCRVKGLNNITHTYFHIHRQFDDSSIKFEVMIDFIAMIMNDFYGDFKGFFSERFPDYRDFNISMKQKYLGFNNYSIRVEYDGSAVNNIASVEQMFGKLEKVIEMSLQDFSDDEWKLAKKIYIENNRMPYYNLESEVYDNWYEIVKGSYIFDRKARNVKVIRELEPKDFRELISRITADGYDVGTLCIQVINNAIYFPSVSSNSGARPNNSSLEKHHLSLQYFSDKKKADYYITDIEKYKSGLKIVPRSLQFKPEIHRRKS